VSKIITTHITVDATVDEVWQTLTTLTGYQEWNPFISSAAGTLALGERLNLTIQPSDGRAMRFKPWVTAIEPHHYLEWLGHLGVPGIFDGRHSFTLTPMGGGRTLLQQSETFTGAMVPFTGSLVHRTRNGFDAMNAGLGKQAFRAPTHGRTDPPQAAP